MSSADLEDVVGTLPAEIVLAGQDDHRLGKHLQADGADQLLLQVLHSISVRNQARFIIHFASNCDCVFHLRHTKWNGGLVFVARPTQILSVFVPRHPTSVLV